MVVEAFLDTMERRLARSPPPDSVQPRIIVTRITPVRATDVVNHSPGHASPPLQHIDPGLFRWDADRTLLFGGKTCGASSYTAAMAAASLHSPSEDDYTEEGKVVHLPKGIVVYRSRLGQDGFKFEYRSLK